MKEINLYNEIKASIREAMEAERNSQEWKFIAREKMSEARTLIAAAKKVNTGAEIDPKALIDFIKAEITEEMTHTTEATEATTEEPTLTTEAATGVSHASEYSDEVENTNVYEEATDESKSL